MKAHTKETQAKLTPAMSIDLLLEGNKRFVAKQPINRDYIEQVTDTASGQYPFATVLSCIDSRIPTEIVFDQGIGDIFNARIAGNFSNADILGSLEFACKLAGSRIIMVMGHTSCGAVKGACDHAELGNLTQMLAKIKPAVDGTTTGEGEERNSGNLDFVNRVSTLNVKLTIEEILKNSSVLKEMSDSGEIQVIGAMYHVSSGKVKLI